MKATPSTSLYTDVVPITVKKEILNGETTSQIF